MITKALTEQLKTMITQRGDDMGEDLISKVRKAMESGEIRPWYQPQFDAVTGRLRGAEALVRWVKPDGTVLSPAAFVPELEKTDAINEVDWFMAQAACRFIAANRELLRHITISVNFSRWHVREENMVRRLCDLADSYGIAHKRLEIEITESALINESDRILEWLTELHNEGFRIAIDDFGSGLSSLQFVKDMPIDVLKIDRSLLSHNCADDKERIVLESIFYFANRLSMLTVAEGVETQQQLGFMRTCGCTRIQGFLLAKPMPEEKFIEVCRSGYANEETEDILSTQSAASAQELLMQAVFRRYPLVIFINVTRDSYYMMEYENFSARSCPPSGVFSDLIKGGASTMHPDDSRAFSDTFCRDNLLKEYDAGHDTVRLVTRQKGDDGVYRRVETSDYFVQSPSSDDILVICLCDNLD